MPGGVGLVSQSGAYGSHLSLLATRRRIGIRFFVTTGNECDVDVAETIGWLARHPDISVIVAYIEGVADRDRLLASLAAARERGKPVILQKVGRTEIGADAVRSHTATLAGSDAVYDGVFRQFGVHRARDAEEMLDVAYAASFGAFPASRRVALMSISGGVGVQMADEAVGCGLEVTPMSDRAQARLKAQLPYASPRNPVDITAQAFNDLDLIRSNLDVVLEEDAYDAVVAFFTFVAAAEAMVEPVREILQDARRRHPDRLLVLSIVGPPDVVQHYEAAGCPVFEDPLARRPRRRRSRPARGELRAASRGGATRLARRASAAGAGRRGRGPPDPRRGRASHGGVETLHHGRRRDGSRGGPRLPRRLEDRLTRHRPQERRRRRRAGPGDAGRRGRGLCRGHRQDAGCMPSRPRRRGPRLSDGPGAASR